MRHRSFASVGTLLRVIRCLRAVLALVAVLALAGLWLALPRREKLHRSIAGLSWAVVLRGFGIRLRVRGAPAAAGSALVVANHMSWVDIAVLGRLIDGGFVAKADVAGWPIIGPLARCYGCLFVRRESRSAVQAMATQMRSYPQGQGLILFPEGTTGDGSALLPFRSSLFVGSERWPAVQPVAIGYHRRDGEPLAPAERRRVAWLGDDALMPHALALAAAGGVEVHVWFEPPIVVSCRKQAAEASRRAIADRLDQAAALKRAA